MVEQICEKCGARYSMYAPACPKCGEPSPQPAKKTGCPQAPAPTKPAPKPKPAEGANTAAQPAAQQASGAPEALASVSVEGASSCPVCQLGLAPLALIGAIVAVVGILKLFKK
ncbi:hypothetical protein [Anaerotardibacter muris]|uniref:hypothetical protein n=1 Tax=Anaerotardibacter muris TaxID=2941505 RepID=UPI00203FBD1C|nr:hypothetical protein [Anaerotardibacter muris]